MEGDVHVQGSIHPRSGWRRGSGGDALAGMLTAAAHPLVTVPQAVATDRGPVEGLLAHLSDPFGNNVIGNLPHFLR